MYAHPTDPNKVFVANPKTGTKSVANAILRAGGAMVNTHHAGVLELEQTDKDSVVFVRNHYRRMVSWAVHQHVLMCDWAAVNNRTAMQSRILLLIDTTHNWSLQRPDSLYYRWTEGVTHVLRYEDGDLFDQLAQHGWDLTPPPENLHVARNIYRPWYEYYDAEFVKHFEPYHDEMRQYGYDPDEWMK